MLTLFRCISIAAHNNIYSGDMNTPHSMWHVVVGKHLVGCKVTMEANGLLPLLDVEGYVFPKPSPTVVPADCSLAAEQG